MGLIACCGRFLSPNPKWPLLDLLCAGQVEAPEAHFEHPEHDADEPRTWPNLA